MVFFIKNTYMYLVISCNCSKVSSKCHLVPPNASHHEHILTHVPQVAQQVLKILVCVNKVLMPVCVDVWLSQDTNIMEWPGVPKVQIYQQPMVVHHHCVVHAIHYFPPIKPTLMGWIVPRLTNFDENTVNKSNTTLELWKLRSQDPTLFNSGPLDFIDNGEIDARCNKDAIIIYCTLVPIP